MLAGRRLAELPDLLGALPKLSGAEAKEFADDLIYALEAQLRAQLS